MGREQFTFYRSFWEALKALPKKDQLPFIMAIGNYVFEDESKQLTGAAAASFLLVKPILDKASKRSESGKQGASKREANRKQTASKREANRKQTASKREANEKQTASHIEGEKEVEREREVEVDVEGDTPYIPPYNDKQADVIRDYLDRVNASASPTSIAELAGYADELGVAVCKRAFDIALDNKKPTWSYIRAILRDKQANGVKCLADWDALENRRSANKPPAGHAMTEQERDKDRAAAVKESVAWMRDYLNETEEDT